MLLKSMLSILAVLSFLGLTACNSGNSGIPATINSKTTPPPEAVGFWVGTSDIQSLQNLMKPDGTCSEVNVSDPTDLGKSYLEAFEIRQDGSYMDLSTIEQTTPVDGLFYQKGTVGSDGSFAFTPLFLTAVASHGTTIQGTYKISVAGDVLTFTTIHQVATDKDGKTWTMDNSTDEFTRVSKDELNQFIAQSKNCAKFQKVWQP